MPSALLESVLSRRGSSRAPSASRTGPETGSSDSETFEGATAASDLPQPGSFAATGRVFASGAAVPPAPASRRVVSARHGAAPGRPGSSLEPVAEEPRIEYAASDLSQRVASIQRSLTASKLARGMSAAGPAPLGPLTSSTASVVAQHHQQERASEVVSSSSSTAAAASASASVPVRPKHGVPAVPAPLPSIRRSTRRH